MKAFNHIDVAFVGKRMYFSLDVSFITCTTSKDNFKVNFE